MQHAQQNYKSACGLALAILIAAGQAHAGIVVRGAAKPLLNNGAAGPCDPGLAGPDYVSGVDVNGNPVLPADIAGRRNPIPDGVLVPLKNGGRNGQRRDGPVVALDGRALEPMLNPPAGCAPERR